MIDYMVMEAVALKANKEEADDQKAQERKNWKSDKGGLDHLRELAS